MGLLEKIVIGLSNEIGDDLTTPLVELASPSDSSASAKKSYARRGGSSESEETPSPSASKKSSQVIQVPQLPLSLNLSDFKDSYSNSNPTGDMLAAIKFKQLVDSASELNNSFMTSTSSIEDAYGIIVNGASYSDGNDFLGSMIRNARFSFKTSAQADFAGHGDWRLVEAIPNDWYVDNKTKYRKVKIPLDKTGTTSGDLDFLGGRSTPTTLTVGDKQIALSEGTYFTDCELEYMLVRFTRPWMDFMLFETNGWWLTGQQSGYCSSGRTDENSGILPLINTGMILVRSAQFEGDWDPVDQKRIDDGRKANKEIYVGPYRLLSTSDPVSTVNVAAWVNELVPLSPKIAKPVTGSVKVNNKGVFVARFSVEWKNNGVEEKEESGNFPVLSNNEIEIPAFATDITIKVDIMTFPAPFETWSNVKTIKLTSPEVLQYVLKGTTFKPKLRQKK